MAQWHDIFHLLPTRADQLEQASTGTLLFLLGFFVAGVPVVPIAEPFMTPAERILQVIADQGPVRPDVLSLALVPVVGGDVPRTSLHRWLRELIVCGRVRRLSRGRYGFPSHEVESGFDIRGWLMALFCAERARAFRVFDVCREFRQRKGSPYPAELVEQAVLELERAGILSEPRPRSYQWRVVNPFSD